MKTVFGFEETQRFLKRAQERLGTITTEALREAALVVERAAKENIVHGRTDWPALSPATLKYRNDDRPLYDKGTLLRSIHSEAEEEKAVIGSGLKYAPVHEFGTATAGRSRNIRIPARPYLEPAANENMKEIKEVFVRKLKEAL